MLIPSRDIDAHYPPPESKGGWRWTRESEAVRTLAGMDPGKLEIVHQYVIPSLDLVVARVGSGPATWHEPTLVGGIVAAIAHEEASSD